MKLSLDPRLPQPDAVQPLKVRLSQIYREIANAFNGTQDSITTLQGSVSSLQTFAATPLAGPRVCGLIGSVNAATPLTKFDLKADVVVLRDASGKTVTRYNTGTLTADLAGTAANSWVHLYFFWDGSALVARPSTVAPSAFTSANLPSGYTHWCYATTIRFNGSSNIVPVYVRGAVVKYDLALGGVNTLISAGTAPSMTTLNCSSLIPPNAIRGRFGFGLFLTHSAVVAFSLYVRPTGSTSAGELAAIVATQVAGVSAYAYGQIEIPLITAQVDYKLDNAPTSGGARADVLGYVVSNGDA